MAKAIWDGTILAESDTYEMVEGNVYFPPESVKWDYLKPGDRQYTCPWKGESAYYNIVMGDKVIENAAWSYPDPKPAAKQIKGYVAFDQSQGVQIET